MSLTPKQVAMMLIETIYDCIKEAGETGIPSGHLYAMMCDKVPLHTYQAVIDALHTTGKIESSGYLLKVREVL